MGLLAAALIVAVVAPTARPIATVAPRPTPTAVRPIACDQPIKHELAADAKDIYSFVALAGETVSIDALDDSDSIGALNLRVVGPVNASDPTPPVLAETCRGRADVTLPASGTYLVIVSDCLNATTGKGEYTITLSVVGGARSDANTCATPLACNTPSAAEIDDEGEVNAFRFPARAGGSLKINVRAPSGEDDPLELRVYDPDGVLVIDTCASGVSLKTAKDGTYTALVSSCGDEGRYVISWTPEACPVEIAIQEGYAPAGSRSEFGVIVHTAGQRVAAAQVDIGLNPAIPVVVTRAGRPNCIVNPEIHKEASLFSFQPPLCTPPVDCVAMRAIVLATDNTDPIPDGAPLFTCRIEVPADTAAGHYALPCRSARSSDARGTPLLTVCSPGTVVVGTAAECTGDCSGDGTVTVDELVLGVCIASGECVLDSCPVFDINDSHTVTVDELVAGVNNALNGCASSAEQDAIP
jgi:hypothetical protein